MPTLDGMMQRESHGVRPFVGVKAKEEFSVVTGIEGARDDDVATRREAMAQEHAAGVDVSGRGDSSALLVDDRFPVLLHFHDMESGGQIGATGRALRSPILLLQTDEDELPVLVVLHGREGELGILEEGLLVIRTTASQLGPNPIGLEGILVEIPVERDEGGVDDSADGDVGEGSDEVVEGHPKLPVVFERQTQFVLFALGEIQIHGDGF